MFKSTLPMMIAAALVPMAASAQTQGTATATARATSQTRIAAPSTNNGTAAATSDAAAQARIRASINRAEQQGVPRSTLEDKVAEGRAKGASSARIATAVEHRAEVLARVNAALKHSDDKAAPKTGETPTTTDATPKNDAALAAELTAAADAYENGVSLSSITQIAARAGEKRAIALNVLASLVASGSASPSQAVIRVDNALRAGGSVLAQLAIGGTSGAPSSAPASSKPAADKPAAATAPSIAGSVTSTTGVIIHH